MEFKPLIDKSRIEVIDALRGFALLGIIIANIPFAYNFETIYDQRLLVLGSKEVDEVLTIFCAWFIDKKFITIFSILFGFGFYHQFNRATSKGINFPPYFLRRMILLLLLGCIHAYIIWFGDILRDYAICGMLLLLFRNWPTRKIIRAGIFLGIFGTGLVFILNGVFEMNTTYRYDLNLLKELEYAQTYWRYMYINFRIDPFVNFIHDTPLTIFFALGCMLFGFWLGKIDFFKHPERHQKRMNRWIWRGCTVGLAASVAFWMVINGKLELGLPIIWVVFIIVAGLILQSLAYISLFVKLYSNKRAHKFLKLFVPVGRLALSNYIIQSVCYMIIFFHWFPGLRLYGKLSLTETYLIALILFSFQIFISHLWLKKFNQGPLEYIWKKWSYSNLHQ
jgi:uncharacterized protein